MNDNLVVALVIAARLIAPLFVGRYPLPSIAASLAVDAADQTIFQQLTSIDLGSYQTYDKALDVYYLALAYLSTIRNWAGGPDFLVGRALWYYRLVGVVIFEFTSTRWVLLLFPNTFEYYFIAIELYKVKRDPNKLSARTVGLVAAVIWVVIKVPQEWWIHVAQLDLTDEAKERVFGVAADSRWWPALTNRPLVTAAIIGAIIGAAGAARRASRLLPPQAWPATFDADRQGERMGWRAPRKEARPHAFFGWAFVEKVALVSLVASVFARILPGADARLTTTVLITAYVIAVNTVVSQWLARHDTTWQNTAVELVSMGLVNLAVLVVTAAAIGEGPGATPLGTTLFLVGLLSLIVVLYDRAHGIFADQQLQRLAKYGKKPETVP